MSAQWLTALLLESSCRLASCPGTQSLSLPSLKCWWPPELLSLHAILSWAFRPPSGASSSIPALGPSTPAQIWLPVLHCSLKSPETPPLSIAKIVHHRPVYPFCGTVASWVLQQGVTGAHLPPLVSQQHPDLPPHVTLALLQAVRHIAE